MAKKRVPATARTLKECRDRGWDAGVVERRLPHTNTTKDLFGFADVAVLDDAPGLLLIQATTGPNGAARVAKILAEPRAKRCLERGLRIEVWSWRKYAKPDPDSGNRKLWRPRVVAVTLEDFA